MIGFIDDHRGAYGVEPICRLLPIARSTYHAHVARRVDPALLPERAKRDDVLKPEIQRVFEENFGVYGVRKVWRQLKREGHGVARCTVARLMRGLGLQGVIRGRPVRTTIGDKATPCPLDHVHRQFKAARPNALWLSDFTYVATWTGFVYVAFIIDAYARGDSYDNALAETINGLYKAEVIHRRGPWRSFEAVEFATLEWVDWFNNRRLMEPIGYIPPAEAEKSYYATLNEQKLAA